MLEPRNKLQSARSIWYVVVIAIYAVICGADDFVDIVNFGRKKKAWFEEFLDLSALIFAAAGMKNIMK